MYPTGGRLLSFYQRRCSLRVLVRFALFLILGVYLVYPASATPQAMTISSPVIISSGGSIDDFWYSEPPHSPSIMATTDGRVHTMWWAQNRTRDARQDALWYSDTTGASWPSPNFYLGPPGSVNPHILTDEAGNLYGVFQFLRSDLQYDITYIQKMTNDGFTWPPPPYTDLFPTAAQSQNPGVAIARDARDGQVRGHIVWEEQSVFPPVIYYGRVGPGPGGITPEGFIQIGPNCVDPGQQTAGCYRGFLPSVAVVDGRQGKEVHVVWEGRDGITQGIPVIYWGYTRIDPQTGATLGWSDPQILSNNLPAKTRATSQCTRLESRSPSIKVAPNGTLHATWVEQKDDCQYYVLTSRLIYSDTRTPPYQWEFLETVPSQTNPPVESSERPRLAFDSSSRRYVLWNANFQEMWLARSLGFGVWETPQRLNTGGCVGVFNVEEGDVVSDPRGATLHAVWVAHQLSPQEARLCHTRIDPYPAKAFLPSIFRRILLR